MARGPEAVGVVHHWFRQALFLYLQLPIPTGVLAWSQPGLVQRCMPAGHPGLVLCCHVQPLGLRRLCLPQARNTLRACYLLLPLVVRAMNYGEECWACNFFFNGFGKGEHLLSNGTNYRGKRGNEQPLHQHIHIEGLITLMLKNRVGPGTQVNSNGIHCSSPIFQYSALLIT
ncbi:hypothetical protein Y1Q_0012711 [Alligator mississippiensis]|uniref:Uncharacterized protein n=1 Tax=Alligator mississippiensis TaxID=8496 RepID=A0A151M8V0_ALLMI|nr:hypothetical protein Y1Q_0012711 [Alligator mississippiensis]